MSSFLQAAKHGVYFSTGQGTADLYDLFNLPVSKLDSMYGDLMSQQKAQPAASFLNPDGSADPELQLKIDILKEVMTVRVEEAKAKREAEKNAQILQEALAIKANRKANAMADAPDEELDALIEKLSSK